MIYRDPVIELTGDAEPQPRGRFLVVGDVHGQMDSLLWGRQRCHCYQRLTAFDPADGKVDAPFRDWIVRMLKPVVGVDLVICGHSVMRTREPVRFGSHLFIDTGAYQAPYGRLTAVDPAAGVYWQVGHGEDQRWGPLPLPAPFEDKLPAHLHKNRSSR